MEVNLLLPSRGGTTPNYGEGTEQQPFINNAGEILVAQGLPILASIAATGRSWWARTSTAAAPVVAIPTTATLLSLWNGEPSNGNSYIIDSIFVVQVAVTAAVQNVGILVNNSIVAVPTAPAGGITVRPMFGNRSYGDKAIVSAGVALDAVNGVATNWMPIGTTPSAQNTLQIGTTVDYDAGGRLIVPPGGILALSALAGAATATSIQIGLRWHERKIAIPT